MNVRIGAARAAVAGPGGGKADLGGTDLAGLEPLETLRSRWPMIVGGVLTAAMIAGLLRELLGSGIAGLGRAVPDSPLFYLFFGLLYLSPVTGDYVIFRRLWGIPFAGYVALIKKRIANEVVFGYSGEAYFYAWARARVSVVAAPFAAVKDVSILSAIAGNAVTLAMVAVALLLGHAMLSPQMLRLVVGSAALTVAMSLPFLLFSRQVFSQDRSTLWWIFGVHCVRLVSGSLLIALAWHFALPGVSVGMWLFLAAGRLLVSRLPLVPNKDLVFASFAILVLGEHQSLSALMAFSAALTVVVHLLFIAALGIGGLMTRKR